MLPWTVQGGKDSDGQLVSMAIAFYYCDVLVAKGNGLGFVAYSSRLEAVTRQHLPTEISRPNLVRPGQRKV